MTSSHPPTIVIGIDGSEASLAALRWALREGAATDSTVEVVHAWHAQTARDVAFGSAHELERGSLCMVQNEVAAALVGMPKAPEVVQTSVHGGAATVLLDRASNAKLLVLGSHEHTRLRDMVFGHVASVCRRHAHCPVIVVDRDGAVLALETHETSAAAT